MFCVLCSVFFCSRRPLRRPAEDDESSDKVTSYSIKVTVYRSVGCWVLLCFPWVDLKRFTRCQGVNIHSVDLCSSAHARPRYRRGMKIIIPSLLWLLFFAAALVDGRWWLPPFFRRAPKAVAESKKFPAGLKNLANTCYMNSVLQGLFHLSRFRSQLTTSKFQDETVGMELSHLFRDMMERIGETVNTRHFATKLGVNINTQEDAQEFLLRVLNDIEESISVIETTGKTARESAGNTFRGEIEQIINCTEVNFTKYRNQKFFDLTVDISGFSKLEDALSAMFTKPEILSGENQYKAGEYGLQDAEKRLRLAKLPKVLCITLKRFTYDIDTGAMLKVSSTANSCKLPVL